MALYILIHGVIFEYIAKNVLFSQQKSCNVFVRLSRYMAKTTHRLKPD